MKVILLQTIKNVGQKGDIKEVTSGYARNFLFPQHLATEATQQAIKDVEAQKVKNKQASEQDLLKTESLAQKLDGQPVEITAKASKEGRLYAAVSAAKVSLALKERGFEVPKEHIETKHIKEVGEHEVLITFDHGLEAKITLIISAEGE